MRTLVQELMDIHNQLRKVSEETLKRAADLGVQEAQRTTLFKHGNAFEQAIKFTKHNSVSGEVVSGAEYSQYLEFGNNQSGETIYPKAGNVLHFFANGEEVFTRHVSAHGPLPFMEQAADAVEEKLPDLWVEEFDKYIK